MGCFIQRTSYRSLLVASAPRFRQATFFSSSSLVCVEQRQRAHPSGPTACMLGVQGRLLTSTPSLASFVGYGWHP